MSFTSPDACSVPCATVVTLLGFASGLPLALTHTFDFRSMGRRPADCLESPARSFNHDDPEIQGHS